MLMTTSLGIAVSTNWWNYYAVENSKFWLWRFTVPVVNQSIGFTYYLRLIDVTTSKFLSIWILRSAHREVLNVSFCTLVKNLALCTTNLLTYVVISVHINY